ncbi:ferritin heavy chain-like [Echinops telfairi]|uniref:Ferritin heavy chain-like n=1 Tax=Echinops telfairi TaxID=9371 RepID=A0AC55DS83_ECHTE|nr:ferritin heavy chain-like [Echinops telfairi]
MAVEGRAPVPGTWRRRRFLSLSAGPELVPEPRTLGVIRSGRRAGRPNPRRCQLRLGRAVAPCLMLPAEQAPPPPPSPSQVLQSYHQACEAALNRQANLELHAAYTLLSMACHFYRDDVALTCLAAYWQRQASKARQQAELLLLLQNQRGGRVVLHDIPKPETDDWGSGLHALERALHLATRVQQGLSDLHQLAADWGDLELCGFLESRCMHQQAKFVQELGEHLNHLRWLTDDNARLEEYFDTKFNFGDSDKENQFGDPE